MKIKMIFMSLFIASLLMLSGCSAMMDHKPNGNPPSTTPKQVVAKVLIFEDGTHGLVGVANGVGDGSKEKKATKCHIKKSYTKGNIPRCKGFSEGNLQQVKSIILIRTEGSICWTTYDLDGKEEQTCWEP